MKVIGVTGGIGSGKSTVSRILYRYGAEVIDADSIAKQVVMNGEKAFEELVGYFGRDILDDRGELDRKKLADLAFTSPDRTEALNNITHKYIIEKIIENVNKAKCKMNINLVVVDVPIPVKHGFLDVSDEVWVVSSDREVRINRVMERSGLTYDEVVKRINSQMSEYEYLEIADRVLYNNGDIDRLEKDVAKLMELGDIVG